MAGGPRWKRKRPPLPVFQPESPMDSGAAKFMGSRRAGQDRAAKHIALEDKGGLRPGSREKGRMFWAEGRT